MTIRFLDLTRQHKEIEAELNEARRWRGHQSADSLSMVPSNCTPL